MQHFAVASIRRWLDAMGHDATQSDATRRDPQSMVWSRPDDRIGYIMAPHSSTGSTWCGNMYCAPSVSARVKFSADDDRLSGLESADDDHTERRCISTLPGNDCGGRSRASFIARRRPT